VQRVFRAKRTNLHEKYDYPQHRHLLRRPDGPAACGRHPGLPAAGQPRRRKRNDAQAGAAAQRAPLPTRKARHASFEIPALRVALHGRSFKDAATTDNLAVHYPEPVPGWLNIGVLHTALEGRQRARPLRAMFAGRTARRAATNTGRWAMCMNTSRAGAAPAPSPFPATCRADTSASPARAGRCWSRHGRG
jgi:hypothetical protein